MSLLLGVAGLALSAGSAMSSFFKTKKAEVLLRDTAARNKRFALDYSQEVYEQRLDEADIYAKQAEGELASQAARQSATGVETSGSALLTQVQSGLNVQQDITNLLGSAVTEREFASRQAELSYQASIDQAETLGSQGTSSLIASASNIYSGALGSGLIGTGNASMGSILGPKALNFTSMTDLFPDNKAVQNVTSNPFLRSAAGQFGIKGFG